MIEHFLSQAYWLGALVFGYAVMIGLCLLIAYAIFTLIGLTERHGKHMDDYRYDKEGKTWRGGKPW